MKALFADTFFYLALVSTDDSAHAQAVSLSRQLRNPVVTTAWVLTEVADALAVPSDRMAFRRLLESLISDPRVDIVPPTEALFHQGIDLYHRRPDKEWSLTDCISFVAMDEHKIEEALTGDRHFEQAGFRILFR